MPEITRRNFLELSLKLAALTGLGTGAVPRIARALEQIRRRNAPALWLQGLSCSGCSVSLLNSDYPAPDRLLTEYISLLFHSTLSASSGEKSMEVIRKTRDNGGYYLLVEGSVPEAMPSACTLGGETFPDQLLKAAARAKAVIAAGSCASFGGIPSAENNPTGAVGVPEFLEKEKIGVPVIRVPGCPVHPDWLVGTIVHVLEFGMPALDASGRPEMFFSRTVHDQCPKFADYEREKFSETFGRPGCLFKLGCAGPVTYADCGMRQWNNGINYCMKAGAPCIGCAAEHFSSKASFPLYTKNTVSKKDA